MQSASYHLINVREIIEMTGPDLDYIKLLLQSDIITGPVLELGAGYGGTTCRSLIEGAGLVYEPTDMFPADGVQYVADFSDKKNVAETFGKRRYATVLVFSILEHTFDPLNILDNAFSLVEEGGKLVVITPAVWTLHNYPIDCNRLLPNWYERYSETRCCTLLPDYFHYVGFGKVREFVDQEGNYKFPPPAPVSGFKALWSRSIHKLFNTYGRGMSYPCHIAIGAVFLNTGKPQV